MAPSDRVELTDLDVFSRYSLAVRHATADRDELVATLRADLAWLEDTGRRPGAGRAVVEHEHVAAPPAVPAKRAPAKRAPAKRAPAAKRAPVKRAPVKKAAAK